MALDSGVISPGSRSAGSMLAAALAALLLAASAQAQDSILYATDAGRKPPPPGIVASSLYTIDPETGEATLVGPIREPLQSGGFRAYYDVNGLGFVAVQPPTDSGSNGPRVLAVGSFRTCR